MVSRCLPAPRAPLHLQQNQRQREIFLGEKPAAILAGVSESRPGQNSQTLPGWNGKSDIAETYSRAHGAGEGVVVLHSSGVRSSLLQSSP
jgi:hypothetical protein